MKRISDLLFAGKIFCKKWLGYLSDYEGGESMVEELFNDNASKAKTVPMDNWVTDEQETLYQAPDYDYTKVASHQEGMDREIVQDASDVEVGNQEESCCDGGITSEDVPSEVVFRPTDGTDEEDADTNAETESKGSQVDEQVILQLPALLEELEMVAQKTTDNNVLSIIDYCSGRICEILLSAGCDKIEGDSSFDNQCHVPSPFEIVPNGSRIEKTLQFGLKYHETVLKKAVVQLQKMDNE